jgi:hypothetical protein
MMGEAINEKIEQAEQLLMEYGNTIQAVNAIAQLLEQRDRYRKALEEVKRILPSVPQVMKDEANEEAINKAYVLICEALKDEDQE